MILRQHPDSQQTIQRVRIEVLRRVVMFWRRIERWADRHVIRSYDRFVDAENEDAR